MDTGPLAWLFIGHPGPRRNGETPTTVETGLLDMAHALCLAPASQKTPNIGGRVMLRAGTAALSYGHPTTVMRLPPTSRQWMSHIALGGLAVVALGLDPIPPGTGQDGIDEYMHRTGIRDRLYMGMTSLRRRWT
ncbi:hypothetical protein [Streptomyces laurentii]|uniref:hypothetical protein n=1 Tax=Streptomyces laurentii TaxID=39478 RepID=UPI0034085C5E